MEDEIRKEFGRLMDNVEKRWEETYSSHDLEPQLLAILNFVKQNLQYKDVLLQCFIDLVEKSPKWKGSIEVIEFCMFELRWIEVKQAIEKIVKNTKDIRTRDALSHLPEAFYDDWDGVEYYPYYFSKE